MHEFLQFLSLILLAVFMCVITGMFFVFLLLGASKDDE